MIDFELTWAYREMDIDRFFRKYPLEEKTRLIGKAIQFSFDAADRFTQRFGNSCTFQDLARSAEDLGCSVRLIVGKTSCPFLSDFDPGRSIISLYKQNINRFMSRLKDKHADCFVAYRLEEMCLLHELCHVMEFKEFGDIGKLAGLGEKKTVFYRVREHRRLSEVAAHSFVQKLMCLPISPAEFGK